jgi:type II secretory pathway pseudopilin PulG
MIKVYMFLMILGILGAVGYGGYSYYKDTQERISTLTANSAKLEQAARLQEETINTMINDREEMQKLNKGLNAKLRTAETYGDQLRNTLRKHNLTHLANKKPGLIERKMQNATNRLWGCLADITDPDRVQSVDGTKDNNCHKGGKNGNSDRSKTAPSPVK